MVRRAVGHQRVVVLVSGLVLGTMGLALAEDGMEAGTSKAQNLERATFAGGCFWCMEHPFDELPGVVSTTAGYTGGTEEDPTYKQVASGNTGHAEAVQVVYDGSQVTYAELLDAFWRNIDPTTLNRQFTDVGAQYRTAIFYHTDEQERLAEASREELGRSGRFDKPIVTEITAASTFYPAEEYHQDYARKNPVPYKLYRFGSGRDRYLQRIWGDARHTRPR